MKIETLAIITFYHCRLSHIDDLEIIYFFFLLKQTIIYFLLSKSKDFIKYVGKITKINGLNGKKFSSSFEIWIILKLHITMGFSNLICNT